MNELSRVDAERTRSGAQSIPCTEVTTDARKLFFERVELLSFFRKGVVRCGCNRATKTRYFALYDDSLTRRQGLGFVAIRKATTRTVDFAESAFYTAVHEFVEGKREVAAK